MTHGHGCVVAAAAFTALAAACAARTPWARAHLVFDAPGELGFSCPMNMVGGTIEVR